MPRTAVMLLNITVLLLVTLVLGGCSLTPLTDRTHSTAITAAEADNTELGQAILAVKRKQQEQSGVYIMGDAPLAFAARALLAQRAQKTIDIQYYIWQADITGTMLLDALVQAAERGVRVRLLLDDNGITGLDDALLALNNHPNIEVRLFNPFVQRKLKWLGYLTHFSRVNRRMHNKSFTVDNVAVVVGGRNIADDYFGATKQVLKEDLDLIAIGDIVNKVSADFDLYWASDSAYPITLLVDSNNTDVYSTKRFFPDRLTDPNRQTYLDLISRSALIDDLANGRTAFTWTKVDMLSDSPAKTLSKHRKSELLAVKLRKALGEPQRSVIIVSPYFVPTRQSVAYFVDLAKSGVTVSILTNSMLATDVLPVHAGYAKHRKVLLAAGVLLYELKPAYSGTSKLKDKLSPFGSSASSLHAKMFAIDDKRLFIGSFNFDPRSININTELGFVIESAALTSQINKDFAQTVVSSAYQLRLNDNGDISWLEEVHGQTLEHNKEPGLGLLHKMALAILSCLPIDSLL